MLKLFKGGLFAAAVLTLLAPFAFAQNIIETEAVTVTVNRIEQELHETNVSAAVVTEEEIKRDPAPTLAEQLKNIPGVMVHDGAMAGLPRISIRGEGTSRVLLLVDGVRISDQKSMSGPAYLIDLSNVERIEVIKGPASVLYGSEAIGGVINIITKKGGNKPIGGTVRAVYNSSINSLEPYASLSGRYEGFNYRVSGSYTDADDRDTPAGKLVGSAYRHRNFSSHVGYDWDYGSVFAQAEYFRATIEVPYGGTRMMLLDPWERTTYNAGVELNNFSDILLKVKLNGFFQNNTKKQLMSYSTIKNDMDSYGGSLQTDWLLFEDHYVIFGADWNYDDLDTYTRYTSGLGVTAVGKQSNLGVFLQDEWSIFEQLKIVGGVRYTWIHDDVDDDANGKFKTNSHNWVGNIGLVYMPTEELALRANVSQGYKAPNLSQRYIGNFAGTLLPNTDLDPERSTNYEIGARYNDGAWDIDAALYYSAAKDYITSVTVSPPGAPTTIYQYTNFDSAKTLGFEIGLSYTYAPLGLTPYTTFNWLHRETENSGFKTTKSGYPPFSGTVGVKWQGDLLDEHTFFADLNYFWNGRTKYEYYSGGRSVVYTYHSFGTVNLNLGFESHHEDSVNYFGSISLNNMLDKEYEPATASIMAPGFHAVITGGITF